jgi:glyoxylase-like metal-dependent hydrolase (beta-lactamase superfamily II)
MIRLTGEAQRVRGGVENPEVAGELADVVLDPPDRTFAVRATVDLAGREVVLAHLGLGHTDNDVVVTIPDADVACAGDLVNNMAPPWFGDSYPLEWPGTVEAMLGLTGDRTVVVPGHGELAGRSFVERSIAELRAIADLAARIHAGGANFDEAVAAAPYSPAFAQPALERALAQLRGELDEPVTV